MRLTALDIYQQDFRKRFRGFDPDEVESFLEVIARDFEELVQENSTLQNRIATLDEQLQEYRRKEADVHEALLSVERYGEEARHTADRETELMLREARLKTETIIRDAEVKAAQVEAQITRLQHEKRRFIAQYRAALDAQRALLDELGQMVFASNESETLSIPDAESDSEFSEDGTTLEPTQEAEA